MEAKDVWVVVEESTCDSHEINIDVFEKESDAKEYAQRRVDAWREGCEDWEVSGSGDRFEAWKDGEYDQYHVCIGVELKEIM